MSSDTSDPTPSTTPIDVAVEGLVLRPDVFQTPVKGNDSVDAKSNIASIHAAVAREKGDFSVTSSVKSIPLWALIPIIGVGIAAGSFLGPNIALTPNVKGYDYPLAYPEGAGGGGPPVDPNDPKVWLSMGRAEYATVCASCHQPNGEGVPGLYPPLKNSEWVINGENRVIAILLHGIIGPMQVDGKAYNGAMPAQGALKNNKSIAQIASYIRNEWGNTASIIYDDQVAELRKELSSRTGPFTEAELRAIPEDANLPPSKRAAPAAVPAAAPAAAAGAAPASAPAAPAAAPVN